MKTESMAKIKILPPAHDGRCRVACGMYNADTGCPWATSEAPGPSCPGPGVYELVPEGTMEALKALAEAGEKIGLGFEGTDQLPFIKGMADLDAAIEAARKMMEG